MSESHNKAALRDILRVACRRWKLFLLGSSLFIIVVLMVAHFCPLRYTGTTTFEHRTDAASEGNTPAGTAQSFEIIKLALKHSMIGQSAVEKVVEDLGLTQGFPRDNHGILTSEGEMSKQELVREMQKKLEVEWIVRTSNVDLVSVSFTNSDPLLAQHVPDALAKNYMNSVSEGIKDSLSASRDFLLKQVQNCETSLAELSRKKVDFETKHAGSMPDTPGALAERMQQISADMDTLRRQQGAAKQTLARLQAIHQMPTSAGATSMPAQVVRGANPEYKRIQDDLDKTRADLDTSLTINKMTENHPMVITLRAKVGMLEERLAQTPQEAVLQKIFSTDASNGYLSEMAAAQSEFEVSSRELERLQERLDSYQALMANFAPIRQEYLEIVKRLDKERSEAENWQKRLTDVQMTLAAEVAKKRTHLTALELAQRQFRPSFPALWMVMAVAFGGGLVFGGVLVLLSNMFDRTVSTTQDIAEELGVSVVGVINRITTTPERIRRDLAKWLLTPAVSLVLLLVITFSTFSVVLWLDYPEIYKVWRESPVTFMHKATVQSWFGHAGPN